MIHLPPYVPKLHSSQILTSVWGRTYESQIGHFPSHFSHIRAIAIPGCLRHWIKSGWSWEWNYLVNGPNSKGEWINSSELLTFWHGRWLLGSSGRSWRWLELDFVVWIVRVEGNWGHKRCAGRTSAAKKVPRRLCRGREGPRTAILARKVSLVRFHPMCINHFHTPVPVAHQIFQFKHQWRCYPKSPVELLYEGSWVVI
jgi:hypothetical protein